jgi:very-short-patch-repair endonuclease
MERNEYKRVKKIECKICNDLYSPYAMTKHIEGKHIPIDEYVKKFGEFRKNKLLVRKGIRKIPKVKCEICQKFYSVVGMKVHLRDTHNVSVNVYTSKYGHYARKWKDYADRAKINKIECKVCNELFGSERLLSFHITKEHNLTKKRYIIDYVLKGSIPKCKCGCGKEVSIRSWPPYTREWKSGHDSIGSNNGMYGQTHSLETIKKIFSHKKMTAPEKIVADLLDKNNIPYYFQFYINDKDTIKSYDFKIKGKPIIIEVDGDYWHGGPAYEKHFYNVEETKKNDEFKTFLAECNGYKVYRFWESDITKNPEVVLNILDIY